MPFLFQKFYNFRNLNNDAIDLSGAREVFFVGENGQGKSNILESLYYAAYGISFRTHSDSQIMRKGESSFSVNAFYKADEGQAHKVSVIVEHGKKRIEKDGKRIHDRKDIINTIPCILFCHDDLRFATGEPEARRFFIDQSLTLFDNSYIDDMRNYKKVLKSRNTILKNHQYDMLDVYDNQLAQYGLAMQTKRNKAIFMFNEIFGKLYEDISGISGVSIAYKPSWKDVEDEDTGDKRKVSYQDVLNILKTHRDKDKCLETTLTGPHRDKIDFLYNNQLFIPTASTGQCRLVSLLLRIAQAVYFTRTTGLKPVLLMDDVLLELDPQKRAKVTAVLPEYDQLFCTFLPGEPYERYMRDTTKIYNISGGKWTLKTN